ncbi:aminotransferase class III-fold pyridoxal phosphate-dependent enzyme [Herbiconiux sp. UC225_62]|uniref:aminotransferase class III-fold pyridoxal phosphate-dependent enzyme n=1 Tax=Herbiconiux sp. UC225_62 TaxID=3350168 RepID=UPI0036D374FC
MTAPSLVPPQPGPRSFAEAITPAPAVDAASASHVAAAVFGVPGMVAALGSQHDANFLLEATDGRRLLLKFAHPSTTAAELTAQSLAAERFGSLAADIAAPRTHRALDGAFVSAVPLGAGGSPLMVRMLDFVSGTPLSGSQYLAPSVVAQLGAYAARSLLTLVGFEHPGTRRELEWDLRNAGRVVDDLLPAVADATLAGRLRSAMSTCSETLAGLSDDLPLQVIHGDITDDNVVARASVPGGRLEPCGIIDFGDVMSSWAVAELAVTCSSVLHHHGASAVSILPAVRAFQALRPLSSAEADALWPLVVARAATLVVSAHHAAATDPSNEYTRANAAHEHRIFDVATSVPMRVMSALVRRAAGFAPASSPQLPATTHPLLPGLARAAVRFIDLSSASDALAAGLFESPDAERLVASRALRDGAGDGGAVGDSDETVRARETGTGTGPGEADETVGGTRTGPGEADETVTGTGTGLRLGNAGEAVGVRAAATRFGERRLTRSFRESPVAHPCAALCVEVTLSEPGQAVHAPWSGILTRAGGPDAPLRLIAADGLTLELAGLALPDLALHLSAPGGPATVPVPSSSTRRGATVAADAPPPPSPNTEAGTSVRAGDVLGTTVAEVPLAVRVLTGDVDPEEAPWFTTPELLPGWLPFVLDPTPLLTGIAPDDGPVPQTWRHPTPGGRQTASGLRNPTQDDAAALLERRAQHLAAVQEHYFADPPEIERGWRHHLYDTDARPYLDMVNNVAAVGHAHPRIADAVARQLNLLNTNSRFNYASIAEFSERLADLLPDPLDTVFLVNSGTEAVDLALRISWAWSGRRDVVAVREAYHGWSDAADAVSTSVADNPQALETRPPWVHTLDAPNAYRGRYRGADARRYAVDAVATIQRLQADDHAPATFIAEAFYGNAGGMPLPDDYLRNVYPAIRAAGGLCIADEVQVGYGRLGEFFWGFEQQGVLPDIVTVAKAMGNGHPLGAVITTRAIADRYRSQGYFFSSAGGSPVSSVVGTTVLDILADEGLQQNARVVGSHLKHRLESLADKHDLIGAVHGLGLYLGVELVRDRDTREPADVETAMICERMRELGVIVQPTSDRQCVLKIKPPMTLTVESADYFADALDTVLTHGW